MVWCNHRVSQLEGRRAGLKLPQHHGCIKKPAIVIVTFFIVCTVIINCKSKRVKNPIISEKEIDLANPSSKFMYQIRAAVGELEASQINKRMARAALYP